MVSTVVPLASAWKTGATSTREAIMTLNGAEGAGRADAGRGNPASLADQIRALSPPPLGDGSYYAQDDVFSSDEEMEFFVTSVREARRAGTA